MDKTFTANFQPRPGISVQHVETTAMNSDRARDKLEAQYGKGTITNVQSAPTR